ncbi:DNA polymerase III subunit gamma/tau [Clostridium sp.]|uniref:DNA polymerase III subunit gamma/tau n=1 Tax=Clostridium sp. TaxID=1506 RepID=UPI002627638B|nr:DNA polymerase III subunit gamma/tau [Clostridium sp.]
MAYKALYREWRPQTFNDVVGQEHITTTLKNQIINGRTAHAYLFCGTRGTGKTSTAKVMAKALNCLDLRDGEPCNKCEMCKKINEGLAIDITELDAASNNGVDNIRDIIDDVQYPPQEAKFKVYIMDEVHMLSIGAVNAFLKTLEEPPKNVVFILATTDPQKLPITILSRCQRFDFKRISRKDITGRLRKIVTEQGVFCDDRSLDLVARVSDGAMRDSLSILDQAISIGDGKVDYDELVSMLGLVTNDNLFKIVDSIIKRDIESAMEIIEELVLTGKDMTLFIKDLIVHYRNLLMIKVTSNPEDVLDTAEENIEKLKVQGAKLKVEEIMRCIRIVQECDEEAKVSKQARVYLELAVIKMCKIEYDTSKEVMLSRINKLENMIKSGNIKVNTNLEDVKSDVQIGGTSNKGKLDSKSNQPIKTNNYEPVNENSTLTPEYLRKVWKDILETFKSRGKYMVYMALAKGISNVSCNKGVVEFRYTYDFKHNKERLEKPDFSKIVNEVFSEVLREPVRVVYSVEHGSEEEKAYEADLEARLSGLMGDGLEIIEE